MTNSNNAHSRQAYLIFISAFCFLTFTFSIQGQVYTTTGNSSDWNSNAAWDCEGNGCKQRPGNKLNGIEVNILHDMTYNSGSAIEISSSTINLQSRAVLTINNNLFLKNSSALLNVNDATLIVSQNTQSSGAIGIMEGFVRVQGNFKSENQINLDGKSCIEVSNGNFENLGTLAGTGNLRVLNGNVTNQNINNWSNSISYCLSGNISGSIPPSPLNCVEVLEACECAENPCVELNPDILPGFFQIESDLISPALVALALDSVNAELNDDLFVFDPAGMVLIDIDFINYQGMLDILDNYNTGPVVYDGEMDPVKSNTYTVFFPVGK